SGVVCLNVQLEVFVQTVVSQKANHRRTIKIILVLGGLHRLGFNEERSLEAVLASVIASNGEETRQVILLTLHVGVQKAHVTLTTAPKDVVLATEFDGRIQSIFELSTCVSHHSKVG